MIAQRLQENYIIIIGKTNSFLKLKYKFIILLKKISAYNKMCMHYNLLKSYIPEIKKFKI